MYVLGIAMDKNEADFVLVEDGVRSLGELQAPEPYSHGLGWCIKERRGGKKKQTFIWGLAKVVGQI